MKKTISCILIAAMTIMLAAGCSGAPAETTAPAGTQAPAETTAAPAETTQEAGTTAAETEAASSNLECDIVVIGAGGAGLVAALQAADNGAGSVIVVEKRSAPGGNSIGSTGGMNAAKTPNQDENEFSDGGGVEKMLEDARKQYADNADIMALADTVEEQYKAYQESPEGYFDSVELFELDTMVGGKGVNNLELVKVLAENSAESIVWLREAQGADLSSVGQFGGASVKRIHRPVNEEGKTVSVGSYLVPILSENCKANEKIEILTETTATEILMEDGAAAGIVASGANGTFEIKAKAVSAQLRRLYHDQCAGDPGRRHRDGRGGRRGDRGHGADPAASDRIPGDGRADHRGPARRRRNPCQRGRRALYERSRNP